MRQVADGPKPHFSVKVFIDGAEVCYELGTHEEVHLQGILSTPTTRTAFCFAALRTTGPELQYTRASIALNFSTDDPAYEPGVGGRNEQHLGTIRIKVERVVKTSTFQQPAASYAVPTGAIVHERNKKHILGGQSIAYVFSTGIPICLADSVLFLQRRDNSHGPPKLFRDSCKIRRPRSHTICRVCL